MTNDNLTEGEKQLLLSKYKNLQSDSEYLGQTFWSSAGIFTSITTAAAGWVVKSIILDDAFTTRAFVFGLIISFVMVLILACLIVWLKRINTLMDSNNYASKQIEQQIFTNSTICLNKFDPRCYANKTVSSRKWFQKCPLLFCLFVPKNGETIGIGFFLILIAIWLSVAGYFMFKIFTDC